VLHEREQLKSERQELLENNNSGISTSTQQLGKIQALEKQLEAVDQHSSAINTNRPPTFIQIPDTKTNAGQIL
jgi:hypothetical protein